MKVSTSFSRLLAPAHEAAGAVAITFLLPLVAVSSILATNFGSGKVAPSALAHVLQSPALLKALAGFAFAIVAIHAVFFLLSWLLWRMIVAGLRFEGAMRRSLSLLFFLLLQAASLALNTVLFPESHFLSIEWPHLFLFGAAAMLLFSAPLVIRSVYGAVSLLRSGSMWRYGIGVGVAALSTATVLYPGFASQTQQREHPDIILIGIDSLRPDHLGSENGNPSITPNLDAFLSEAWLPERAYTPLARTYPSWVSILTGRYPFQHGGRFNLIDRGRLQGVEGGLPYYLKRNGYATAYAIDETRFSNIDESYGFYHVLTPRIGAADFLLSELSDLPLANLLSLTPLYKILFPHQYMNRAVHVAYDPALFDGKLGALVGAVDSGKPLFLAVHFELPHWPYVWRDAKVHEVPDSPHLGELSPSVYQAAVNRADQQFGALMDALNRHGRLGNAIVAVLSDHGEGFQEFHTPWTPAGDHHGLALPPFALHGVNVMDEAQTRVLMGFRAFGSRVSIPDAAPITLASLTDIAPTVLNLAGFSTDDFEVSGCSLLNRITSRHGCDQERVVFTESGFYVKSMVEGREVNQKEVASEAQIFYAVSRDGRLTLKEEFIEELLAVKQRAAIFENWIVASVPFHGRQQFLVGDLAERVYWNATHAEEVPDKPAVKRAMNAFCLTYGPDSSTVQRFCESHELGSLVDAEHSFTAEESLVAVSLSTDPQP